MHGLRRPTPVETSNQIIIAWPSVQCRQTKRFLERVSIPDLATAFRGPRLWRRNGGWGGVQQMGRPLSGMQGAEFNRHWTPRRVQNVRLSRESSQAGTIKYEQVNRKNWTKKSKNFFLETSRYLLKTPFTNNRFYMTQKGEAQEGFPFYGEGDVSTLHVDSVPAVRFPMLEWSFMTPGLANN